ncbi:MAG: PD40 domain-containing protein [Candidatus Pacebacteria bacterium]|nr:PD40 domain-containing protein [Candidatus Paceibacterota bacterium]
MKRQQLNFMSPSPHSLRALQVSTFVVLASCVALGSALIGKNGGSTDLTASIADATSPSTPTASVEPPRERTPKVVSENTVLSSAVDQGRDSIRFFEKDTGKSFRADVSNLTTSIISADKIIGFQRGAWVPLAQGALIFAREPSGVRVKYLRFSNRSTVTLDSSFVDAAVSPDGQRGAFIQENNNDSRTILTAALDGSNPREYLVTRASDMRLYWKSNDALSFTSRRSNHAGYDLTIVDSAHTLRQLLTNKENLELSWSPDGKRLLYSYFSPTDGVSLWIWDENTAMSAPLLVPTSAQKCTWTPQGDSIVCGIPAKNTLTRDIPADKTATIDNIEVIDPTTNARRRIYTGAPGRLFGVTKPLVTTSGEYFVFTNMFDARLYVVPLQ